MATDSMTNIPLEFILAQDIFNEELKKHKAYQSWMKIEVSVVSGPKENKLAAKPRFYKCPELENAPPEAVTLQIKIVDDIYKARESEFKPLLEKFL